jgi:hypothetical protein
MKLLVLCVALLWSTSAVADEFCDVWRGMPQAGHLQAAQNDAITIWTGANPNLPLTADGRKRLLSCVAREIPNLDRDVTHLCAQGDGEKAFDRVHYWAGMCAQTNFVTGGFEDRRRE